MSGPIETGKHSSWKEYVQDNHFKNSDSTVFDFSPLFDELIKLRGKDNVVFCENPGNVGDYLINLATHRFLKGIGLTYETISATDKVKDKIIIYGGGGNFVKYYKSGINFVLNNNKDNELIILPHTIRENNDILLKLENNSILFCRDNISLNYIKANTPNIKTFFCPDISLYLFYDNIFLPELIETEKNESILNCFRTDIEKSNDFFPTGNIDLTATKVNATRSDFNHSIAILKKYNTIRTDRLHLAVISAFFGKKVYLYDNNYGKCKAVYESAVHKLNNIIFCGNKPNNIEDCIQIEKHRKNNTSIIASRNDIYNSKKAKVYVSFTTISSRIKEIEPMINSILNQTLPADEIYLFVSKEPFFIDTGISENEVPDFLRTLEKQNKIKIEFIKNQGPYSKIIPILEKYWNDAAIIITVDDDTIYYPDLLKTMLAEHQQNPTSIISNRCREMIFYDNKIAPYSTFRLLTPGTKVENKDSLSYFLTGKGGVLYKPSFFTKTVLDREFSKVSPIADDVWLKFSSLLHGTSVRFTGYNYGKDINFKNSGTLFSQNSAGKVINNDTQISQTLSYFSQIGFILPKGLVDSNSEEINTLFDWKQYVSNYLDLQKAKIDTEEKALAHWTTHGILEGRTYKKLINFEDFEINHQLCVIDNLQKTKKSVTVYSDLNNKIEYSALPRKLSGEFWAITTFFNPVNYKIKYANFLKFRESLQKQNLKLIVVELAFFDNPFEIKENDADIVLRLRGNENNIMWQKERLLNIALKYLPKSCDKVAWLDNDLIFKNQSWAENTTKLLETNIVVQPFDSCIRLPKDKSISEISEDTIELGLGEGQKSKSFVSVFKNGGSFSHCGFAWCARKDFLDKFGFFDMSITGSGDLLMAHAFIGDYPKDLLKILPTLLKEKYFEWHNKVSKTVDKKTAFCNGTIYHLWHGDVSNRKYAERHSLLVSENFNPDKDIHISKNGSFEWDKGKITLSNKIKQYFIERKEGEKQLNFININKMDFDWKQYISNYPDLQKAIIDTEEKALKHWTDFGKREGRTFRKKEFSWQEYVDSNDLLSTYWYANRTITVPVAKKPLSICTFAMKRLIQVKETIPTLLSILDKNDEVIFVDYNDPEESGKFVLSLKDSRVKVIKVDDVTWWHMSHARNIAAKFATKDVLVMLDIDVIPSRDLIEEFKLINNNEYLILNNNITQTNSGSCCVSKKDFNLVNGYDETLVNWGSEDILFYINLCSNGISRIRTKSNYKTIDSNQTRVIPVNNIYQDNLTNIAIAKELLKRNNRKSNVGRNYALGGRLILSPKEYNLMGKNSELPSIIKKSKSFFEKKNQKFKYYLSLCAIIKNECDYVNEWIEYHRLLGVEKFYIYDNNSTDAISSVLEQYIKKGIVEYIFWPKHPGQVEAYMHCVELHKNDSFWIGFIDIDEFIMPFSTKTITKFLEEFENGNGLGINWLVFGTSHQKEKPKGLQTQTFFYRSNESHHINKHIKSIINPRNTTGCSNPHFFYFTDNKTVLDENKNYLPNGPFSEKNSTVKIRINHYITRSESEYSDKLVRGRADTKLNRKEKLAELKYANLVKDTNMQKYNSKLLKALNTTSIKEKLKKAITRISQRTRFKK